MERGQQIFKEMDGRFPYPKILIKESSRFQSISQKARIPNLSKLKKETLTHTDEEQQGLKAEVR